MIRCLPYLFILICVPSFCFSNEPLPRTKPLQLEGDLAMLMVNGIDQYLMNTIEENTENRNRIWEAGTSSEDTYPQFIESKRKLLIERLALTYMPEPVRMQWEGDVEFGDSKPFTTHTALVGENELYSIYEVKWKAFRQVEGVGFLLVPKGEVLAAVVAVPDADQTPEDIVGLQNTESQTLPFAGLLAQQNCLVIVPTLINRKDTYSGVPDIRMTNQPHREYLWRASYVMGRTVIGYELYKITNSLDWAQTEMPSLPLGIAGYGEGGLLALYTAALNKEVDAALVGGYFQSGEHLWQQPIDRNVWKLRQDFGEAEIAALIAPRQLIVEASSHPIYDGPPNTPNRSGAAPGALVTPDIQSVKDEFDRVKQWVPDPSGYELIENNNIPMGEDALNTFLKSLGIETKISDAVPIQISKGTNPEQRLKNQFDQILEDTQFLMRESEFTRKEFWADADASSPESWEKSTQEYKDYFLKNIIGELPESTMPLNPRSKQIYDEPNYTGYQVVMDVYPGVFAYGILLLPKDIQPGEQRPVVVCQHGLEGRPRDVADPNTDHYAYHQYACQLADQGFITFSPQNPYIGEDRFRVLLRKGQPLGITLFSFIVRQHERILEWLADQPFVDADRIAFYGLSYGGKTAMRIPALLDGYCLSICSADYNEWIWKNVSARHKYSYLLTGEYDMPEFNLGNTFNYAEMSQLIFPRPFMVERGHHDGVAPSEWVAYEYARTQRHYDLMGLGDRTEIEFFNGPHTINGKGTFAFLHKHLNFE